MHFVVFLLSTIISRNKTQRMIPIFLWARLQLFIQFSAQFHMYEWHWRYYLMLFTQGQWQKKMQTWLFSNILNIIFSTFAYCKCIKADIFNNLYILYIWVILQNWCKMLSPKNTFKKLFTKILLLSIFFFCYQQFFIYFFHTQHNIQNKTKQNSRHILNISRFNQKGGREGRTTRTQKLLL